MQILFSIQLFYYSLCVYVAYVPSLQRFLATLVEAHTRTINQNVLYVGY